MAQREDDIYGEGPRYPVRTRRMERPVLDEGTRRSEAGRPGYGSFGAERGGYRPGSYDRVLERMEARRGPARPPRGYQRSDERIREDVCELLMEGPVDVGDVEVTVSNGEVTLSGTVEARWEKRVIEDLIANVRGVHDVHNRVRVRPQQERPVAREATRRREDRPKEQPSNPEHMGT
jgi:hypothetical protein